MTLLLGVCAGLYFGARSLYRNWSKTPEQLDSRYKELKQRREFFSNQFIKPALKWGGVSFAGIMAITVVCNAMPVYLAQANVADDCERIDFFLPFNHCGDDENLYRTSIVAPWVWLMSTAGMSVAVSLKLVERMYHFGVTEIKQLLAERNGVGEAKIFVRENDEPRPVSVFFVGPDSAGQDPVKLHLSLESGDGAPGILADGAHTPPGPRRGLSGSASTVWQSPLGSVVRQRLVLSQERQLPPGGHLAPPPLGSSFA